MVILPTLRMMQTFLCSVCTQKYILSACKFWQIAVDTKCIVVEMMSKIQMMRVMAYTCLEMPLLIALVPTSMHHAINIGLEVCIILH